MIKIRKYRPDDARAVAALISKTYSHFNFQEGTKRAVRDYIDSYSPEGRKTEDLHARFARTPNCFVALASSEVIGMVRGIENNLINLFVDGEYHRQGIATRLVHRFEKACKVAGFTSIALRGSLYATPFYESIGYRKTTGIRNFHGLKIQPMKKRLE
jgi:GNAT superfamily N-acetyltransferase